MTAKQFSIGRLATLTQVTKALGKTIRAMANGSIDTADGARICHGLGIMRACLEAQRLEQLETRMEKIIEHVRARRVRPQEAELYVFPGANRHDRTGLITVSKNEVTDAEVADETEQHQSN